MNKLRFAFLRQEYVKHNHVQHKEKKAAEAASLRFIGVLRNLDRTILFFKLGNTLTDKVENLTIGRASVIPGDEVELVMQLIVNVQTEMLCLFLFLCCHDSSPSSKFMK